MTKKIQSQYENNRDMILKTTSKMFCSKGIGATSISDIAKAVNLSKGTISYYFPSKEDLVFEAANNHFIDVTNKIFDWIYTISPRMTIEDTIFLLLSSIFDTVDKCRLHICLIYDAIMGHEVIEKIIKEKAVQWHSIVTAGLKNIGYKNPERMTDSFFMALDTVILRRATGITSINEHEICDHIAKYI